MFYYVAKRNVELIHEFHLSPPGSGRGMSCDANGAFIGDVPLLKRSIIDGKERWEPRECGELSKAIRADFGLPIDMSSKMGGVRAIANALNEGDVARAQIATVLLGIPDLPILSEGDHNPAELVKCIYDQAKLAAGGLTLPIHSSSHPNYDLWTSGEIIMEREKYGDT